MNKGPDETACAQDVLNLNILRMFEGTFSLDIAHLLHIPVKLELLALEVNPFLKAFGLANNGLQVNSSSFFLLIPHSGLPLSGTRLSGGTFVLSGTLLSEGTFVLSER